MKKALLWMMLLPLFLLICACGQQDDKPKEPASTPSPSSQEEQEPEMEVPVDEVFKEAAFLYTDDALDLFMVIASSKWAYTKDGYTDSVLFYPQEKDIQTALSGFVITSRPKQDQPRDTVWEASKQALAGTLTGLEWIQDQPVNVGVYTGVRYHFWNADIKGDFIIWETQSLLYTCTLTASQAEYDEYLGVMLDSLETFYPVSEMPYG